MASGGAGAGLETREFCRKEDPRTLEVRVGFVRVCRDEFLTFEVFRVDVIVADIQVWARGCRKTRGDRLVQVWVRFAKSASQKWLKLEPEALVT